MKTTCRRIVRTLCFLLLLSASLAAGRELPTARPEDVGVSAEKVARLSEFMQSLVDDGKIAGGVTMMARHGKVIHLKAVGMADREQKIPVRTDAIFRIASMTKPITSVAIMKLVEQGKLDLDDPLSKYIPEFKAPKVLVTAEPWQTEPARGEITIRQLLTHTSGLGYTFTETLGPIYDRHGVLAGLATTSTDLETAMTRLAGMPLLFHPGEKWEYGMSTDVLGRVVEVASGRPLDEFVEDEICRPLGMNDTFFKVPSEKRPRLAAAYVPVDTCIRKLKQGEVLRQDLGSGVVTITSDYAYAPSHRYLSGGAGLCSTAADYMRFCEMLRGGGALDGVRLLSEETVRQMTSNQVGELSTPFGFGFGIMPASDDVHAQLQGAYAWSGFWSTSFRVSPRGDWILVTMAQLAWDDDGTPAWHARYETLAAEAIIE